MPNPGGGGGIHRILFYVINGGFKKGDGKSFTGIKCTKLINGRVLILMTKENFLK